MRGVKAQVRERNWRSRIDANYSKALDVRANILRIKNKNSFSQKNVFQKSKELKEASIYQDAEEESGDQDDVVLEDREVLGDCFNLCMIYVNVCKGCGSQEVRGLEATLRNLMVNLFLESNVPGAP